MVVATVAVFRLVLEFTRVQLFSPLLFILVLEALSREFRNDVLWELLYADDLAIAADASNDRISKVCTWNDGIERKVFGLT